MILVKAIMKISYTPGKVMIQLSKDECTREHHFYPNNYKINKKPEKKTLQNYNISSASENCSEG